MQSSASHFQQYLPLQKAANALGDGVASCVSSSLIGALTYRNRTGEDPLAPSM